MSSIVEKTKNIHNAITSKVNPVQKKIKNSLKSKYDSIRDYANDELLWAFQDWNDKRSWMEKLKSAWSNLASASKEALLPNELIKAAKWEEFSWAWVALDVAAMIPMAKGVAMWAKKAIPSLKKWVTKWVTSAKEQLNSLRVANYNRKRKNVWGISMKDKYNSIEAKQTVPGKAIKEASSTYIAKANKMFLNFIRKDKKIKKEKDSLKKLLKQFESKKPEMSPEQILLMENHITNKKLALNVLISKTKTRTGEAMKKTLKVDKEFDAIINPKSKLWTFAKGWAYSVGWLAALWVGDAILNPEDETNSEWDLSESDKLLIEWGDDIPSPLDLDETNTKELEDTIWKDNKKESKIIPKDNTFSSEKPKVKNTATNNSPKANNIIQTGWAVMDRQGNKYPVFRQWDALKIVWPDKRTYVLIKGVTDDNQPEKYALASTYALPF